jgi:pyruvate-formate lyase
MQIDVIDADVLRRAQEDPDRYKTLSVRVSGWNARFVTLNREWQEMIIERTEQKIQ